MSVYNREIAERLRTIRDINDVSIQWIAQKIGVTEQEYERFESGEVPIPVSILYEVGSVLSISMTELLTGEPAKLHTYSLVRKGKGLDVERSRAYKYQNLAFSFSDRKVEPLLVTVEPTPNTSPFSMNTHQGQEYQYCLEGEFQICIDNHVVTLYEGDSIYFDSRHPHGMRVTGDKEAKILVIVI